MVEIGSGNTTGERRRGKERVDCSLCGRIGDVTELGGATELNTASGDDDGFMESDGVEDSLFGDPSRKEVSVSYVFFEGGREVW